MNMLHLSHIDNSVIALGGDIVVHYGTDSNDLIDLLLQVLEMNRKLVSAISKEWESEEDCLLHVLRLIEDSKRLELSTAEHLKSKHP